MVEAESFCQLKRTRKHKSCHTSKMHCLRSFTDAAPRSGKRTLEDSQAASCKGPSAGLEIIPAVASVRSVRALTAQKRCQAVASVRSVRALTGQKRCSVVGPTDCGGLLVYGGGFCAQRKGPHSPETVPGGMASVVRPTECGFFHCMPV